MVALTEQTVKGKTKLDKLEDVKNLNLWGQDITDVSILQHLPNVEVLSLSVNKISSLKSFQWCSQLKELYLRKNEVPDIQEVGYLMNLRDLKILWLSDNPCAEQPSYRKTVIKNLPALEKLDNQEVTPQERQAAAHAPTMRPIAATEVSTSDRGDALGYSPAVAAPTLPSPVVRPQLQQSSSYRSEPSSHHDPYSQNVRAPQPSNTEPLPHLTAVGADITAASNGVAVPPKSRERPASSSKNVLYAVMALVAELDENDLSIVQREIEQRLAGLRALYT
eukprot:jgi/Chrzof1/13155/Cz07g22030.t1